jgi:hypothetical protein
MTDRTWRDELVDEAKKWPASFRAELSSGHWRLQGANEDVYRALKVCAERFVREIRHPDVDADPIDVLLDHLNEGGEGGRIRLSNASVSPLRDAVIDYLNTRKDAGAQNRGDAWAAMKSREITARVQIIEALQRLGVPHREWPDFVMRFYVQPERTEYSDSHQPTSFQAPVFDRLHESPREWTKRADAAWQQHRDHFLEQHKLLVTVGVDEDIPRTKSTRGAGRTGRRLNAPIGLRIEWAASRLSGAAWKEIANESFKEDQVKKAANEVLKLAGWVPIKPKRSRSKTPNKQRRSSRSR